MDIRPLGSVTQGITTQPGAPSPQASTQSTATLAAGTSITNSTASTPAAKAVAAVPPEPSIDQVHQAVQKINVAMTSQSQGIAFSVDATSHRIVVNIVDQQTNQVIRQIPSKEALAIADSLDQTQGLLIKQQA